MGQVVAYQFGIRPTLRYACNTTAFNQASIPGRGEQDGRLPGHSLHQCLNRGPALEGAGVGIKSRIGDWSGHGVLECLDAFYRVDRGPHAGKAHGRCRNRVDPDRLHTTINPILGSAARYRCSLGPLCVGEGTLTIRETIMSIRPVKRLVRAKPTLEGAGVHLRRAFGFGNTSDFDPFLLLDDFRNDIPEDYLAGFPWHPHRGIETITYVLAGTVEHGDSLGNRGAIAPGDVQWMTAGSGIIHQEMPKGDQEGRMHGFQLWGNLPSSLKMTPPRYQEVKGVDIPLITDDDGTHVRIVCGTFWGKTGPVDGVAADPIYLDVSVAPGRRKSLPVETTRHAFAYVFAGGGKFCNASGPLTVPTEGVGWLDTAPPSEADNRSLVLFDQGDEVTVQAGEDGIRFLLVSGKPLGEPVAWYGPIVMNTQDQLRRAFEDLDRGTFLNPQT
jgi:redox-sensitive bicupin YhaK (pirin superfamily)